MRPVVGAERVLHAPKGIRPRLQRVDGVAKNAHDLGLPAGETLLQRVQRGGLAVSGIGESEREEREHHGLSAERRKRDLAAIVRAQREVRSGIADL